MPENRQATDNQNKFLRSSKFELIRELKSIEQYLILRKSRFRVYLCPAPVIPNILQEIGLLREKTFRLVGEGTGKEIDIDKYDQSYLHLFIWDHREGCIVGGYRLGVGRKLHQEYGIDGFYLSSLFEIHGQASHILTQSLELGRSFIIPSYQKQHFALLLLWKGILHHLLGNPECKYLIGPVSISKYYSNISKSVIVTFIKRFCYEERIAAYFKPRRPFLPSLEGIDLDEMFSKSNYQINDLETFLNTIEPGHIRVPILLKQYAKQNAKFIGFNLDPNFSDALDGLMILDVAKLPASTLNMLSK